MNEAALSKIRKDTVDQQVVESGFVELVGGPEYLSGAPIDHLIPGRPGPFITDIAVDTNPSAGVTTRYTMRSWTPRLGKLQQWTTKTLSETSKAMTRNQFESNKLSIKDKKRRGML